ncbi:dTDP-glucose 4,6-dehydratase [Streptomyces zhaozhouensis]|uniref:dTDP-glucose 4,6-dehydratase n=1 Tax=Streptomyces zhaozhouensis TaxID=1300267 RepID=A0A286DW08_9ACTN|nr:UDP-glucuronic acid decarboxylase family protein [Streptomyces zhaozhouensis]SOD62851.1 dTDP-glucose 4,6-dehydratase [Streptomyces zhaozhouensis]
MAATDAHRPPGTAPERVVITGGAGFVGSHLVEHFLRAGAEVVCLDDFSSGSKRNLEFADHGRLSLRTTDVSEECEVEGPVDAVLHLASPASPVDYLNRPLATMRVGSQGTWNALELARRKGARLLLASTSEVYGDPQVHPQPESYWGCVNPIGPRSVYDESKRFSEALTMAYHQQHGVDVAIVRIFNTYGPRMRHSDGRAVPTFIAQALAGEPLTISGDGSQTRSFCYVDDLVAGIAAMLRSDLVGPVNLGNPEEYRIDALARRVKSLTGSSSPVRFIDLPVDDPRCRRPDISRARRELGWAPTVGVTEGLRRTVAWFRRSSAG